MSRHAFSVSYSGAMNADDHSIDVEALAPALLAFGRLVRESNFEFNGKKSTANVLVTSDFEHKCFNINFEAVISVYTQLQLILGMVEVKTAKDVLEWIGLIKSSSSLGLSFLGFLKWKKGRKIESTEILDKSEYGTVQVKVEGDNNMVIVDRRIFNLSSNPKALKATRDAFTPIGQDGFETISLGEGGDVFDTISPDETEAIIASCNNTLQEVDDEIPEIEVTTAWLSPYSPVYDEAADKWRFKYGNEHIYADISQTNIAQHAIERGGAMVDDAYQVQLEITTPRDKNGRPGRPSYKILKTIKFVASSPASQGDLFDQGKK
ncbi:MAG TPA: hypothetical protein VEQ35_03105 [Beijerinckia sp.]|jgi:hypothetical protein|nr:hypothetical protein [Beijerinckia sp.]